jgi:S1-C subfamily serine protease
MCRWLTILFLACTAALPLLAQTPNPGNLLALQRASDAVVGVLATAVEDARSAATLGRKRQGSGVVISEQGLVLTIGYLILEAEQVQLLTDDRREIPARVVAYDLATGFGLVQALVPLKLAPVPLGQPAQLAKEQSLMIVSGGAAGSVSPALLVDRRAFAGYWEYAIDGALFTSPPRGDHSGAALFNAEGELVGIGSLFVADALGPGRTRLPGNMFVPVDLLQPILSELLARGSSSRSTRAWLGVNCVEQQGAVRIVRVNEDSPADVAGLEVGDQILRIDDIPVQGLAQLWQQLWSQPQAERAVKLAIRRAGAEQEVVVHAVDRAKALRRPQGI